MKDSTDFVKASAILLAPVPSSGLMNLRALPMKELSNFSSSALAFASSLSLIVLALASSTE